MNGMMRVVHIVDLDLGSTARFNPNRGQGRDGRDGGVSQVGALGGAVGGHQ